jgi:hypothetical protein
MEWFDILRFAIPALVGLAAAFCPSFLSKRKAVRVAKETTAAATEERDAAVAEAAAAKAELDLMSMMQTAVQAAEVAYQAFDAVAKQNGTTTGAMKREHVLDKLQAYALSKGYPFDAEKMGAALDAYVAATKVINAITKR